MIFCSDCKYYIHEAYSDGVDYFFWNKCKAPENVFKEHDYFKKYKVAKEPTELNKKNDCKFFSPIPIKGKRRKA